jgi:hypothetical protein
MYEFFHLYIIKMTREKNISFYHKNKSAKIPTLKFIEIHTIKQPNSFQKKRFLGVFLKKREEKASLPILR